MLEDPIVAEIHRTRHEIFARFGNDMDAYLHYTRLREEEQRKRGREIITAPLRPRRPIEQRAG